MAMSCTNPGKANPSSNVAGQERLETYDRNSKEMLERVLAELQKMNIHLSLMTDEEIRDYNIQED